jgi:hypothetical protein
MTRRKAKAAPKAAHHRHAKWPGRKRKLAAHVFTSMLAPLLVGLALQTLQARHASPQPPRTRETPAAAVTAVPAQTPEPRVGARPVLADADERDYRPGRAR